METWFTYADSPVGRLLLVSRAGTITRIEFESGKQRVEPEADWSLARDPFGDVLRQLEAYFERRLRRFDLPLAPAGTPFQQATWSALTEIPYGETRSYADIARTIGRPRAVRAVGAANGANPIPIVIPCHRVVGSNGDLTGFGGGLDVKRQLLLLEGSLSRQARLSV